MHKSASLTSSHGLCSNTKRQTNTNNTDTGTLVNTLTSLPLLHIMYILSNFCQKSDTKSFTVSHSTLVKKDLFCHCMTFLSSISEKNWGQFACILLLYSPFNLVANTTSSLSVLYSASVTSILLFTPLISHYLKLLRAVFSVNLSLFFYLSIPLQGCTRRLLYSDFLLSPAWQLTIHPSSCGFASVIRLFRLVYNSPPLFYPSIYCSSIIIADRPSLIQPFLHLYHPS